jgi:hypothetical protein
LTGGSGGCHAASGGGQIGFVIERLFPAASEMQTAKLASKAAAELADATIRRQFSFR